eukprot:9201980-Prorocentrum_lima.AAC.1
MPPVTFTGLEDKGGLRSAAAPAHSWTRPVLYIMLCLAPATASTPGLTTGNVTYAACIGLAITVAG